MEDLTKVKNDLIKHLQTFIVHLSKALDSNIDEHFYSDEVITEYLSVTEIQDGNNTLISAHLESEYEYNLFNNLLYEPYLNKFFHYTSFESLFYIISGGKLHLSSLIGLNDKSEINFVNNYMGRNNENPYQPLRTSYYNSHFIFCLSEKEDQLNQWRLYSNDATGAMLEFEIDHHRFPDKNMKISRISYSLKLFELIKEWLRFCKSDLGIGFGFHQIDYWKYFYKNEDYQEEHEIRLLIKNTSNDSGEKAFPQKYKLNRYGIIVPYIEVNCLGEEYELINIKSITVGPKCKEPELAIAQIRYFLSTEYPSLNIDVKRSRISHYR